MDSGRMPACDAVPYNGECIASGVNQSITGRNANNYYPSMQRVITGNRCGHQKNTPSVFQEPKGHKTRPRLIVEGRKRLRLTYYNPYIYAAGQMTFHKTLNNNGKPRKMRSEKRDAITHSVGEAILHYANIEQMAVGFMDKKTNKFVNIGISKIAEKAAASYQRARDAIRAFEEAGTLKVEQSSYKNKKGEYRNNNSHIRLTKQFFYNLGFDDNDIQHYASKQKAEEQRKILEQKRLSFKQQERTNLKFKKKERFNEREKNYLNKETPGWNRSHYTKPVYVDYTGIAPLSPPVRSDTAIQSIKSILSKLRQ